MSTNTSGTCLEQSPLVRKGVDAEHLFKGGTDDLERLVQVLSPGDAQVVNLGHTGKKKMAGFTDTTYSLKKSSGVCCRES